MIVEKYVAEFQPGLGWVVYPVIAILPNIELDPIDSAWYNNIQMSVLAPQPITFGIKGALVGYPSNRNVPLITIRVAIILGLL